MSTRKNERKGASLKILNMHIPSHILMIFWVFIALFPVYLLIINSFKQRMAIYSNPFGLPGVWTLDNYIYVVQGGQFLPVFLQQHHGGGGIAGHDSAAGLAGGICPCPLAHQAFTGDLFLLYPGHDAADQNRHHPPAGADEDL